MECFNYDGHKKIENRRVKRKCQTGRNGEKLHTPEKYEYQEDEITRQKYQERRQEGIKMKFYKVIAGPTLLCVRVGDVGANWKDYKTYKSTEMRFLNYLKACATRDKGQKQYHR